MHLLRTVGTAATTTTMATTLALLPMPSALADPAVPRARAEELRAELRERARQADAATEAYNAARERLAVQTATASRISSRLAEARAALSAGRADAGRLARRQYRGAVGVLPPALRLLLSENPHQALGQLRAFQRAAESQARLIERLGAQEQRARRLRQRARRALDAQRALTAERRRQRDAAVSQARTVRKLLASVDRAERARRHQLHSRPTRAPLPAAGRLGDARAPSAAGSQAVRYALRQLGKPYGWGAAGPDAFDCSGLTSQAWSAAGYRIPRTSQDQWRRLNRVELRQVRPGDLVVYTGATHVALYVGAGAVVHAPRPGTAVRVEPLAFQPVLGAVRPDVNAPPLTRYAPPPLAVSGP